MIKSAQHTVPSTYTTDCMRRVTDEERGIATIKRWQEQRQVTVTVTTANGRNFWKGAAI